MHNQPIPLELRASACIQTFSDGSFQEDPDGADEALLIPIRDEHDEIIDVVAWKMGTDRPWWRLRCIGDVLGYRALAQARWPRTGYPAHKPELVLYESPARWLRAVAPNAICILDWSVSLANLFAGIDHEIICESAEIRDHFETTLQEQRPVGLSGRLRVLE